MLTQLFNTTIELFIFLREMKIILDIHVVESGLGEEDFLLISSWE